MRVVLGGAVIAAGIALVQGRMDGWVRRVPLIGGVLATLVLGGCGGGAGGHQIVAGCATPLHDRFDPHSTVHVLPGAPTPSYLTNPPTSGVHQPVNVPSYRGVKASPIAPQIQVALLESSQVLVQYRPPVAPTRLLQLATDRLVTLAPNASLPAPVVATAWTWRMECAPPSASVITSIQAFVAAHGGNGPQAPPP